MSIAVKDRLRFTAINKIYDRKYLIFKTSRLKRYEAAEILVSLLERYTILAIEHDDFDECCILIMDYFISHLDDYVVISLLPILAAIYFKTKQEKNYATVKKVIS